MGERKFGMILKQTTRGGTWGGIQLFYKMSCLWQYNTSQVTSWLAGGTSNCRSVQKMWDFFKWKS